VEIRGGEAALYVAVRDGGGTCTWLYLDPTGRVLVQCVQAPPVLWFDGSGAVTPLAAAYGTTTVGVRPGDTLLACSPSLLDVLDPAELLAAPHLTCRRDGAAETLARWVGIARDAGIDGAAVAAAAFCPER
jgi:hypothetical protein